MLALASSPSPTHAQTIITNTYAFTFPTSGPDEGQFYDPTWIYWYNSPGGNQPIITDPTTDASNPVAGANTSDSGSLEVISPLAGYTQDVFFGCFADSGSYNFSTEADTTKFSSVSFDILVASNTPLSSSGNYGAIQVGFISSGYGYEAITGGTVTIPASASSNWFHVSVPIDQTQGFGDVPGIALDINSYGGYPLFTITNWIDNISINGSVAPPPPPPTLTIEKPVTGLNLIDTSPSAQYNRYQIADTNDGAGGLSFVGQSSVTYSWTIKKFPTNDAAYSYQAHFFMVSGSDSTTTQTYYPGPYDQAADYNLANCIFLTIQSDGNGGGIANFRYKTNEIAGNGMLFNTTSPTNAAGDPNGWPVMPIVGFDSAPLLGTWSLTFSDTTNITLTAPGGASTNFTMDAASAALFADPVTLILGAQPNTAGYTGLPETQAVIYSSFSLTGTSAAFTDNFTTDSSLNTNYWEDLSNDTNGCLLIPSSAAYWVGWSLPAPNYALAAATNLTEGWGNITPTLTIKDGATYQALLSTNSLPAGQDAFFAVVQRTFSQLLVLLPGETNAPNTSTGKVGTPTPFSLSASGGLLTVTVLATDAHFNPVPGINDTIQITDNGGGFDPNNAALVNGSGQYTIYFGSTGNNVVVTATDVTSTNIAPANSTAFNINP